MKMVLFGWLLKGRCEVSLLDQVIGWGFVIVSLILLWFLLGLIGRAMRP